MLKVQQLSSRDAIGILCNLVNFNGKVLDTTYGNGLFWSDPSNVIGCDLKPERAKDLCCDFHNLPFANNVFEMVVFDPPFHPFVGSHEEARFSGMGKNEKELKTLFQSGVAECWRVTSKYLIVKCQDYVHNHQVQWMPLWAINVCGEPFEWLIATRLGKLTSSRWVNVKSLRRNHADYLMFCKTGNHR